MATLNIYITAFRCFKELCEADYQPTIMPKHGAEYEVLDEYDRYQERIRSSKRCWRGSN